MKEKVTPTQKALNLWAMVLIVWSIYRSFFKMPIWFDEFIAKPAVFVLPVAYYLKQIDKTNFFEGLWFGFKSKKILSDVLYGFVLSSVFFAAAVLAIYVRTGKFAVRTVFPARMEILTIIILAIATAVTEEILSRGFVLKKLYEESRSRLSSIFFSSILFFILHVPILFSNSGIGGNLLLTFMVTDLVLSVINGFIFLERKSLIPVIVIHAAYNIMASLLFL